MTTSILLIVMLAALLHASWNAIVKASSDRTAVLGLIALGHVVFGVVLAANVPVPDRASWVFIAASTLVHFAYYALLARSYRLGDLSQVYPIARGVAPVLVALGAFVFAGEVLPQRVWIGIFVVTGGIFLLSSEVWRSKTPPLVIFTALATGIAIAAYSLIDGIGVRKAEATLGYIAWLFIFEIFVAGFVFAIKGRQMLILPRKTWLMGLFGGVISAAAYGLVIYAKAFAPLGMVSTLRETSVLFAALIGVLVLGERPWRGRLAAAIVVLFGVVLIAVSAV